MVPPNFKVVLVEPEIPTNTGNIGRTCVGMNSELHLVGELGFEITDKAVKRAGLDYWPNLSLYQQPSLESWTAEQGSMERVFFFTTKVDRPFYDVDFQVGDTFVFGKETKGLPESLLQEYPDQCVTIPFVGPIRSFNLSNAVCMALSEGMRQLSVRETVKP